jgi:RNA polymerase-associated protein RTF1
MILSERATKKGDKELKEKMIMRMNREKNNTIAKASSSNNKPSPLPSSTKIRSSARNAEKTAAKGDVLSELRAKRMKQQIVDNHGKSEMKKKKTEILENSPSSSSESESVVRSESEKESSSDDDGELVDSDDDKNIDDLDKPTFEDIKEITIR